MKRKTHRAPEDEEIDKLFKHEVVTEHNLGYICLVRVYYVPPSKTRILVATLDFQRNDPKANYFLSSEDLLPAVRQIGRAYLMMIDAESRKKLEKKRAEKAKYMPDAE